MWIIRFLPGFVIHGCKGGPAGLVIPSSLCNVKEILVRPWKTHTDSHQGPGGQQLSRARFHKLRLRMSSLCGHCKKVMLEGRKEGARRFHVAGELNVELGLPCVEDSDDLKRIYGPQCWYGIAADPGGLQKAMWLDIMTEFNCKTLSTLLSRTEKASTRRAWG